MSRTLLKRWRAWVWFVVLLAIVGSAADYFYGANSDAMSFARETIQSSKLVRQRIGSLRSVDLDWLWGFRQKSGFAGSKATLRLSVAGTLGRERIVMDLQEIDGHWHVIRSSTPI